MSMIPWMLADFAYVCKAYVNRILFSYKCHISVKRPLHIFACGENNMFVWSVPMFWQILDVYAVLIHGTCWPVLFCTEQECIPVLGMSKSHLSCSSKLSLSSKFSRMSWAILSLEKVSLIFFLKSSFLVCSVATIKRLLYFMLPNWFCHKIMSLSWYDRRLGGEWDSFYCVYLISASVIVK